jgi:hypothetical protein
MPRTSAVARLRAFVSMFYLCINLWRLLCGVSANKGFCGLNARLPEGVAGLTGYGSVVSHRFVGVIEFSGWLAFTTLLLPPFRLRYDGVLAGKLYITEFGRLYHSR